MAVAAALGWSLVLALGGLALSMRRRLELVARADHELRGPLAALGLLRERLRRADGDVDLGPALEAQLLRAQAGLADLHAARSGRQGPVRSERISLERQVRSAAAGWEPIARGEGRSLRLDWQAGEACVSADGGRLTQALGNLISNAIEHGGGRIELRGRRVGRSVRVEVADEGSIGHRNARRPAASRRRHLAALAPLHRGRGLTIAARAVQGAGGTIEVSRNGHGSVAAIELPAEDG